MKKAEFIVVLSTGLATNRGSYGVGQPYPCETEDEAERMVLAGQATWQQVDRVSTQEHDRVKLAYDDLLIELTQLKADKLAADKRVENLSKELAAHAKKSKPATPRAK